MATMNRLLALILVLIPTVASNEDPCITATKFTDDAGRSPKCKFHYNKCDRYLESGWYRFISIFGGAELIMPTTAVKPNSCGTQYPIWMNGSQPDVSDGVVNRVACVASYTSSCRLTYNIAVKNCTDFMVYNLLRAQGCSQRYCFESPGVSEICSPPTTTTTTTTTTTRKPTTTPTTKTTRKSIKTTKRATTTLRPIQTTEISGDDNGDENERTNNSGDEKYEIIIIVLCVSMLLILTAGGGLFLYAKFFKPRSKVESVYGASPIISKNPMY